jgi:hypothetical protein
MPCSSSRLRLTLALAPILILALGLGACNRSGDAAEAARVKIDFDSFRAAILARHADQAVAYLPQDVNDYLSLLNSEPDLSAPEPDKDAASAEAPGVSLLVRTALDRKVNPSLRGHLDLQLLLQRVADRGLLNCREVRDLSLGHVSVHGDRASSELYFQGKPLPLRLPFVKEQRVWKIDLLAMLPYAEVLMRLDRALTGKTESQQVDRLVAPLPIL